jgi:hypothetical protein
MSDLAETITEIMKQTEEAMKLRLKDHASDMNDDVFSQLKAARDSLIDAVFSLWAETHPEAYRRAAEQVREMERRIANERK